MRALSIRTKLISVVTIILVAGFVATNLLNYQVSRGALRTTILENELPLSSNNVYSAIQADLLRPIFISSLMANDTFLHDWVTEGEVDASRMVRYLTQIRSRYETFTSYFISANSLKYYHFEGVSRTLSETNPEDRWFFEARDSQDPYVVNVDFNYQQNRSITIFINYRVIDENGTFLGITGVGLGLGSVSSLVKRYREQFRRDVYFVDDAGLIRVHADPGMSNKITVFDIEGLGEIANEVLRNQRGSYTYQNQDDKILLTTRYIPELKWHLFIELPESQALKDMQQGFIRNLMIGPVVILITVLLIAYTINIFQRRLEDMAITDKLTNLHNRQHFELMLEQGLARFKRSERPFSLLMMDIDHFKSINDTLGHLAGDEAIRRAGRILRSHARENDVLCRWGGDEFIILAEDCTAEQALRLAEDARHAIHATNFAPGKNIKPVTLSVGITQVIPGDGQDSLIDRADAALYKAKENGRDRIETVLA